MKRFLGGPEGIRTPDLLHAMEALYQLRYKPRQDRSFREQGLLYMIGVVFSIGLMGQTLLISQAGAVSLCPMPLAQIPLHSIGHEQTKQQRTRYDKQQPRESSYRGQNSSDR